MTSKGLAMLKITTLEPNEEEFINDLNREIGSKRQRIRVQQSDRSISFHPTFFKGRI